MCGRYFFQLTDQPLPLIKQSVMQTSLFDFRQGEVFPTQNALVLVQSQDPVMPTVMKWGITGYQGKSVINARSESIHERVMFRSFCDHRCLVVANGFYEWQRNGSHKDKIYIQKQHQPYLLMAGIYNQQREFVIVTGAAEHKMAAIHKRTPIIMNADQGLAYLQLNRSFIVDNEALIFQKV